ncbi:hypothetical protein LSH36_882g00058 [Paralvinella palmiformis]|uniref:CRAL-TRIO domain-containing protein n=1 Tax=Paralvinella palmiformis TaxID=53620 RepID=A0AAD9IY67_9ANNE|nr:hypothetical protein LSH36_882g00058 [Paralvinella palmiformis]
MENGQYLLNLKYLYTCTSKSRLENKYSEKVLQSMTWRDEIGADNLLETYTMPEIIKKYYPGGLCGHDKEGRPIWIDPLGRSDMKGILLSVKKSDVIKSMIQRMELFCSQFSVYSKMLGKHVDQGVQILDMEGFGARIMYKPALDLFIELLHILDDNYPETLKRTYIINAPRMFHVGWRFLKTFLNEDTAKKFKFLDKDFPEKLLEVIDADQLPVYYGGTKCDPDGNPKCESLVCYGGIVPKELYKNRDDFFPPGIPPKQHLLGRSGTFSVGFSVPDSRHVIQYVFAVDWGTLDFGVFLSPVDNDADGATICSDPGMNDVNKMDVFQPITTIDCSRVPEDGLLIFEKPGYYCVYFRNTSRIYRKTLTYVMDVKVVQETEILDTDVTMETATGEITQL